MPAGEPREYVEQILGIEGSAAPYKLEPISSRDPEIRASIEALHRIVKPQTSDLDEATRAALAAAQELREATEKAKAILAAHEVDFDEYAAWKAAGKPPHVPVPQSDRLYRVVLEYNDGGATVDYRNQTLAEVQQEVALHLRSEYTRRDMHIYQEQDEASL